MVKTNKIWIVGCGDIGRRVAGLYQIDGILTSVTARSVESIERVKKQGHNGFSLDLDCEIESNIETIQDANVFYFVAPQPEGRTDLRLQRFLDKVSDKPNRIVLISTTGVYGDCKGAWVNEESPVKPQADRAYRRADAEQQLTRWAEKWQKEYIILRVPGIYAKDRLPLTRLEKSMPIVREEEAPWTNRIHADDLAMVCKNAMDANEISGEIYNVTDSHPSTMTNYFNQVADYAGLPRPRQISLEQAEKELSRGMMSYMKESRRISNQKMLEQLNIKLRYPSLNECLKN